MKSSLATRVVGLGIAIAGAAAQVLMENTPTWLVLALICVGVMLALLPKGVMSESNRPQTKSFIIGGPGAKVRNVSISDGYSNADVFGEVTGSEIDGVTGRGNVHDPQGLTPPRPRDEEERR